MPTTTFIAETDEGVLELKGNELILRDKTSGDPVKWRARSANGGIAALSIDALINGSWIEIGYLFMKSDERPGKNHWPVFEFWKSGSTDNVELKLFSIAVDGITAHVPLAGAGPSGPSSFLRSPSGQYEMEIQNDGNVVVYDEWNNHTAVSAFPIGSGV